MISGGTFDDVVEVLLLPIYIYDFMGNLQCTHNICTGGGVVWKSDAQHILICNSPVSQLGSSISPSLQLSEMSSAAPLDMDRYSGIWGKYEAEHNIYYCNMEVLMKPSFLLLLLIKLTR